MKLPVFEQWLAKCGLSRDEVAFVGDDIPDLPVMQAAGLSVAPADAAPEIRHASLYVSHLRGGYGCGRDVTEQVLRAQGKWMTDAKAFGW